MTTEFLQIQQSSRTQIPFCHKEYVVGDCTFLAGVFCSPPHCNPTGGNLSGTKECFDNLNGCFRVVSEQGLGHLKEYFPIISSLLIALTHNPSRMWEILDVIDMCVILHNFILIHIENSDNLFFYMPCGQQCIQDPLGYFSRQ